MKKFFTRRWYEYIYNEMKDCLPKVCYLRYMNNGDFFDKIITNDAEYSLDKILIDKFEKYFSRKKNYIASYSELEERFGNYEKIDELCSYEEELEKYKKRLDFFVNENKGKLEKIINKLKNNDIDIEINLYDDEFALLGLNVLKPEIRKKYMEIKSVYRDNLNNFDDLIEEELNNIDWIRNDVDAFLTCKTDYLASRKDKFSEEINHISFHDSIIVKYEKNGIDAVLDIKEYGCNNLLRRFTFKNVQVNTDIVDENAYDLINATPYFESGWVEIYGADYGNYDDYNYYLKLFLPWTPGETALSEKKRTSCCFICC